MSEHSEQAALMDWCRLQSGAYPELALVYAIPNGAALPKKRAANGAIYSPQAKKLKDEGMKPGVPDLCLPVARNGWHGLYLELKYGRNTPSEAQEWWLNQLEQQGYCALVCWGAAEAIEAISDYLGIGRQS